MFSSEICDDIYFTTHMIFNTISCFCVGKYTYKQSVKFLKEVEWVYEPSKLLTVSVIKL